MLRYYCVFFAIDVPEICAWNWSVILSVHVEVNLRVLNLGEGLKQLMLDIPLLEHVYDLLILSLLTLAGRG
jgi:hypothetical protein